MNELSKKLNKIVDTFIKNNVSESTKYDFVIAAIHFNINLNDCDKYDLMRINHQVEKIANIEEKKLLTSAAIFNYILYKALNNQQITNNEDLIIVKLTMLDISTAITEYMTYRIDEISLNEKLYKLLQILE